MRDTIWRKWGTLAKAHPTLNLIIFINLVDCAVKTELAKPYSYWVTITRLSTERGYKSIHCGYFSKVTNYEELFNIYRTLSSWERGEDVKDKIFEIFGPDYGRLIWEGTDEFDPIPSEDEKQLDTPMESN